ncbi:MAG: hemolysin family protein [Bacteroidia bacterium]
MEINILVILISIVVSAFFSGMEIAFISSNKLLIELKSKQGNYASRLLSPFVGNPSRFVSTTLVGTNIGLVVYGVYMAEFIEPILLTLLPFTSNNQFLLLFISTIVSTAIVLVAAEFIPKMLFRINPDITLRLLVLPFLMFYYLFWPVVHFITWISKFILNNFLRLNFNESTPVFSKVDLDQYITDSAEDLEEDADVDTEMFKNALDFANVRVRDCMTPRTELVSINIQASIDELYQKFLETGLSKILVHQGSVDHIIGYVHQKDIFKAPASIRAVLIPIEIATETLSANDLLNIFSRSHKSIALVVDELGITAGIVTLEDIMEEIFGEIEDEHDVEQLTEKVIGENEYLFSARLEIDYLNNKYELNIPEGDYQTLGGYIFNRHESIPGRGEVLEVDQFIFTVIAIELTRIVDVKMTVKK